MSIHQQVLEQVTHTKGGKILFPVDFRGSGTDSAIKMSLSRMVQDGYLVRLSHGIYFKPLGRKMNQMPTPEQIAFAIAEREKIRIKPAGNYAIYQLGLTTEMPKELTFITDGEPRRIQIGDNLIIFKSTTPKKLSMRGPIISLLMQALEHIGKDNITSAIEKKAKDSLQKEDPRYFQNDIKNAPAWIYNLLIKIKPN